jgi:hypothetical protein
MPDGVYLRVIGSGSLVEYGQFRGAEPPFDLQPEGTDACSDALLSHLLMGQPHRSVLLLGFPDDLGETSGPTDTWEIFSSDRKSAN